MKAALVQLAQGLGFDTCRIAAASMAPHTEAFHSWVANGCMGEMAWMARNPDRRTDPRTVLEGARSVILLAMNYFQPDDGSAAPGRGRIARYAWGADYHDIVEPKLKEIDFFLKAHGGTQKPYVDTGPVLERDFAAQSGIGWQGKSTMLLNERLGTWFFLAAIITTLELSPDEPIANRCGRCTRCIDVCPTGAITHAHHVDARLCISYLTIENKGSIPVELRPLIGNRIYGCDECLEVCPWNRFAVAAREIAYSPREYIHGIELREFLRLDDDAFRKMFKGSPIKRVKRRGFLRNVCVAMGNVGTEADLPALELAANDPEPLIAEHAQWAIAQINRRSKANSPEVGEKRKSTIDRVPGGV